MFLCMMLLCVMALFIFLALLLLLVLVLILPFISHIVQLLSKFLSFAVLRKMSVFLTQEVQQVTFSFLRLRSLVSL